MDNNETNDKRAGFLIAIGILLENGDAELNARILAILESFGHDLSREIETDSYAATALDAGVNPCPPGWHWDSEAGMCVLN